MSYQSDREPRTGSRIANRDRFRPATSSDSQPVAYSDQHVVFHEPFTLGALREVYPAGRYVVETGEESFVGNEHTTRIRTSTMLIVATRSGIRAVPINGEELQAALKADAERRELRSQNENPDSDHAREWTQNENEQVSGEEELLDADVRQSSL